MLERPTPEDVRAFREENEIGLVDAKRILMGKALLKELGSPDPDIRAVLKEIVAQVYRVERT